MPLYEYQCNNCGHRFEKIVKFSDAPIRVCPQCGQEAVEQLLSAPAVQFKGEGWYVTDYARKNNTGSTSSSSDKKIDASASTESKSETKSESKSDSPTAKSDTTSAPSTTPKKP